MSEEVKPETEELDYVPMEDPATVVHEENVCGFTKDRTGEEWPGEESVIYTDPSEKGSA